MNLPSILSKRIWSPYAEEMANILRKILHTTEIGD
jgi:hypothetical protein